MRVRHFVHRSPTSAKPARPRLSVAISLILLAMTLSACSEDDLDAPPAPRQTYVFNAEANRLHAYNPATGEETVVIPSRADDPAGLDINAQICFMPDGSRRFIAGEDTGQTMGIRQGWGLFQLHGDTLPEFSATQLGKMSPTYQLSDDNAENYGCGFLSDGRLLTSDVGNQAMGTGDGQLIIWFPPFDRPADQQRYCKLDVAIATAGAIYIDSQDRVYVTTARGGDTPGGGRVFRFSPPFPTSNDASGGCGAVDSTGAPFADNVQKETFIAANQDTITPSAVVETSTGTFYVASVFNGVIAEYSADGEYIRDIVRPDVGDPLPYVTGTPYGMGLASDGTIYYADIGIVLAPQPGPGRNLGTVRQIRFENGEPLPPEIIDAGLNFPDGIGILEE
jgi:sugar lactone lactonase YvrE